MYCLAAITTFVTLFSGGHKGSPVSASEKAKARRSQAETMAKAA